MRVSSTSASSYVWLAALACVSIIAGGVTTWMALNSGRPSENETVLIMGSLFDDHTPPVAQPAIQPPAQGNVEPATQSAQPYSGASFASFFVQSMDIAREMVRGASVAESLMTPESYHMMARLRQQMYCKDAFPANFAHAEKTPDVAGPNTTTYRVDPKPVYVTLYAGKHMDIVSNMFLRDGQWEVGEQNEIQWALDAPLPAGARPTSTLGPALFVDVGVNLGMFSLKIAGKGYEVVGFEAMNGNQRMIRTSMCASHPSVMELLTLHAFALGARRDQCYMIANFNWGNGVSVCGVHSPEEALKKYGNPEGVEYWVRDQVTVEKLDNVLQRDVKVMKIDVEGFEPMVLQGARKLLTEYHVWFIVMEINKVTLNQNFKDTTTKIYQHVLDLHKMGYRVGYSFRGPFLSELDIINMGEDPKACPLCSIFFVHRDLP